MATWYEKQRKDREAARRLRARGICDEPPLFSTCGRGCALGRRPVSIPPRPQAGPTSESPDGVEKQD